MDVQELEEVNPMHCVTQSGFRYYKDGITHFAAETY